MTALERDRAEHRAALKRFGGRMPKGPKGTVNITSRKLSNVVEQVLLARR